MEQIKQIVKSDWFLYGVVAPIVFVIVAAIGSIGE
jgi:hypothetical protein